MELFIVLLVPAIALLAAITWLLWQVVRGIRFLLMKVLGVFGAIFRRLFGFVRNEVVELVQLASAGLSLGFLLPFTAGNFLTGRWSRARHYANSIEDEFVSVLTGAYRVALAHPLRLIGLGAVLEGVERRMPSVVEAAPKQPRSVAEAMQFEGYELTGTLKAGGSGAQLYMARPKPETQERFKAKGREICDEVVIKSFALVNGSTLPQIIRESRALEAANRLGLIYEHDLDEDRFFYVMPYVKGDNLDVIIARMHERSGPEGLNQLQLALALGYAGDLLRSLDRFHVGGLWHKDVKPANLIVAGERAHLVDFGLVTPLHSALTLTTHGTEYYRDPEMVRLAMQGVKVHEVDGVKFDLYSAGAVLFSMIENSFPAHGSLSQLTKKSPEALAWIVRRSMADIGSRYSAAWEMLDDLKCVAKARDPFKLRPADLPSMQRQGDSEEPPSLAAAANRFGLPKSRVQLASRLRATKHPMDALEQPPKLPSSATKVEAPKRGRRRRRLFAVLMICMLSLGALAAMEEMRDQRARLVHLDDLASRQAEANQELLENSRASESQKKDYREAQAIRELVEPKRGSRGADLAKLHRPSGVKKSGRQVYILQDFSEPASAEVMADIQLKLRAKGYQVAEEGVDQTRDAALRFLVGAGSVGDIGALANLQEYLDGQEDLAAVLWICEGESRDTGLYELVLNRKAN